MPNFERLCQNRQFSLGRGTSGCLVRRTSAKKAFSVHCTLGCSDIFAKLGNVTFQPGLQSLVGMILNPAASGPGANFQ